ncbi:MAG: cyclic nucleotide-binding domain-containing protein [Zetaproteobacteria bacterium]|nr:cyclic nucleotide-binding domain-containing protein [Zetaproteobacteria bacterium]
MSAAINAILEHPGFPRRKAWWREDFGAGQAIIEEGDITRDLYLIESGVVRVNKDVEVREDQHMQSGLLELSAGEIFGELNLFGETTRSASVVALTKGVLIHIDGSVLSEFMDQHVELGYALMKEFFIRISDALSASNDRFSALYARQLLQDEDR